jgi:hypothetical protein
MTQCPDGGKCGHGCGEDGACYRVSHFAPLTSYGEDWSEEVKELHSLRAKYEELCHEWAAIQPFEVDFRSAQRRIGELELRARAVDILLPVAEQWLDAFSDDDRMSWIENLRYTEVLDTVAALRAKETT